MEWSSMLRGRTFMLALGLCVCLVLVYAVLSSRKTNEYNKSTVKISSLLSASIRLTELAGKKVVDVRHNKDPEIEAKIKGQTKEGANEYVTLGDQKSNRLIVGGLMSHWPSLHLRSEEVGVATENVMLRMDDMEVMSVKNRDEEVDIDDVTIWIDPLDATQEYTEGGEHPELLEYVTVMICIVVGKYPVAGVIHQPFAEGKKGVTYWGWVDHGVSKTLRKSRHSQGSDEVRIVYSRSHAGDISEVIDQAYKGSSSEIKQVVAAGSGYKTLQVIQGKADVYLHTTKIKKWDTCAGNAIINSVGGTMTTITGDEIDYSHLSDAAILEGLVTTTDSNVRDDLLNRISKISKL